MDKIIKILTKDLKLLSHHLRNSKHLEKLLSQLFFIHQIQLCIGIELEFYLSNDIDIERFSNIIGHEVKSERGVNQFEIAMHPSISILPYIEYVTLLKSKIIDTAKMLGAAAYLESKPFPDDYGNSLQINISFIDAKVPRFMNLADAAYIENQQFIKNICQYLCYFMIDSFYIFMPNESDYLRIDRRFMSPTHVSFGNNNRTTALRIPDTKPLRIEHRLPCASTDLYLALVTILQSVIKGLERQYCVKNIQKTYGNAYDDQYDLKPLPTCCASAIELFNPEFIFE